MKRRNREERGLGRGHGCVVLFGCGSDGADGPVVAAAIEPAVEVRVGFADGPGFAPFDVDDAGLRPALDRAAESIGLNVCGLRLGIRSKLPVGSGPCGPAAVCVALVRALAAYSERDFGDQDAFEAALEIGAVLYGRVSAIEAAVATWGGVVAFRNGMPVRRVSASTPLPLVVSLASAPTGDTGRAGRSTEPDRSGRGLRAARSGALERATSEGESAVESGDLERLGWLLTANHRLLQDLSLSNSELDAAVEAAHAGGALGARASRCGGGAVVVSLGDGEREALIGALGARGFPAVAVEVATASVWTQGRAAGSPLSATA